VYVFWENLGGTDTCLGVLMAQHGDACAED
jgi:hypothetical protein